MLAPYFARQSATLLQVLGQCRTLYSSKEDLMKSLICLNKLPSALQSHLVVVKASISSVASVSKMILDIPNYATFCSENKAARASPWTGLATRCKFPQPPSKNSPLLSLTTNPHPPWFLAAEKEASILTLYMPSGGASQVSALICWTHDLCFCKLANSLT